MNNGIRPPQNYGGYRSKRRRRRAIAQKVTIAVIAALLLIGMIIFLISIRKKSEEAKKNEESTTPEITETEPDETTLPGILDEGYITKRCSPEELHKGDLILVRAGLPYVFPEKQPLSDLYSGRKLYSNGTRAYQISSVDIKLAPEILECLNNMTGAFYEETGENSLLVKSAYRSFEEQQEIYDYRVERDGEVEAKKYVALPGESEHHTAMAFDMSVFKNGENTYIQDEEAYLPIYESAHKYGFVLRYPEEKSEITGISYEGWHFRYVGVPHAYYMYKENLCLEEYIDLLSEKYSYDSSHLMFDCDDGHSYEIYSVPAREDGSADILVPTGVNYTLSGNNRDAYIVTVITK